MSRYRFFLLYPHLPCLPGLSCPPCLSSLLPFSSCLLPFSSCFLALTLITSSCVNQFASPPQILSGGINSQRADQSPAYSSDGRYLAFASDRNRSRDIFLYDLQQKRLVDLPNLNRRDSSQDQPALSSDGRFIAYVSSERGKTDILVYDRIKQSSRLLTAGVRGSVRHPTITGDGRYVAYETSQLGQWNIAIVERN
ncbi:MAG: biopolymer transporter [Symploca sp. SIO2E6]|nr:biopolymer transporter [Symploca sp. SIO2E6]